MRSGKLQPTLALPLLSGRLLSFSIRPRAEKLLTYETLERLITTQLNDADIIALSKVDAQSEHIEYSRESVSKINPNAEVITLSTNSGEGLERLTNAILEMTVKV